jgi:hypothetical protein
MENGPFIDVCFDDLPIYIFIYIYTQVLHGDGIFTYMWAIFGVNVGKYSIHEASGIYI